LLNFLRHIFTKADMNFPQFNYKGRSRWDQMMSGPHGRLAQKIIEKRGLRVWSGDWIARSMLETAVSRVKCNGR
jgi:hypothetical protein